MTIGYPSNCNFIWSTSGGQILGHESKNFNLVLPAGQSSLVWQGTTSTNPSDFSIGQGVANKFDLLSSGIDFKGYISQYVYVPVSSAVTSTNVNFSYGHKTVSGSVSVGIYPVGLSVTPSFTTEKINYVILLNY